MNNTKNSLPPSGIQGGLGTLNSIAYLDKALALGHISTIEYFLESNYFYMAFTNYLQTENEYYPGHGRDLKV
jgi:hypothetical protein